MKEEYREELVCLIDSRINDKVRDPTLHSRYCPVCEQYTLMLAYSYVRKEDTKDGLHRRSEQVSRRRCVNCLTLFENDWTIVKE